MDNLEALAAQVVVDSKNAGARGSVLRRQVNDNSPGQRSPASAGGSPRFPSSAQFFRQKGIDKIPS